jgi:hypothetical protein
LKDENAALRQQLTVLKRKIRGRVQFTNSDRLLFIQLYRWCPSVLNAMMVIRPETLVRWHRAGFRHYWRWKSRSAGGRPPIPAELRALIWRMSVENRLWGARHVDAFREIIIANEIDIFCPQVGTDAGEKGPQVRAGPLSDVIPAFHADVGG